MPYTPEQRTNILLNAGYDPEQFDYNELTGNVVKKQKIQAEPVASDLPAPSVPTPQATTAGEAFSLGAKTSALPAATGLMGQLTTAALLGSRFGLHPAITVPSSIVAGFLASKGADMVQRNFIVPEDVQQRADTARQEHPWASLAGELTPFMLAGNVPQSIKSLSRVPSILNKLPAGQRLAAGELNILNNTALQGGLGAGLEGIQQLREKQFDPVRLGMAGAAGLLSAEPNRLGKAIGLHSTADIEAATPPRGSEMTRIRGYLEARNPINPEPLPSEVPRNLPDYVTEGLPGMKQTERPIYNMPENINLERMKPEWRKVAREKEAEALRQQQIEVKKQKQLNDKEEANLSKENAKAGISVQRESGTEIPQATPEQILRQQHNDLATRGIDIQYEPDIGNNKAGVSNPDIRKIRISQNGMRPDLIPHEGLHQLLFDLKNSKSPKDRRLYRKIIEHGLKKIKSGDLNESQRAIVEGGKYSPEVLAEEVMVREGGDMNVERIKAQLESGKSPWLGDVMAHFKYKLGTSDSAAVLRHLNSRYQGDAPYGTRPDLMPSKVAVGGERESAIPPIRTETPSLLMNQARMLSDSSPQDYYNRVKEMYGTQVTDASYKLGEEVRDNPAAIAELEKMRDNATAEARKALEEGRFEDLAILSTKPQFFNEAIQRARNEGSARFSEKEGPKTGREAYSAQQIDPELKNIQAKVDRGIKLSASEIKKAERMEFPPGTDPDTKADKFKQAQEEWTEKIYKDEAATRSVREKLHNPQRESEIEPPTEEQKKFAQPIMKGMENKLREKAFEQGKQVIGAAKQVRQEHATEGEVRDYNEANDKYKHSINELEAFTRSDVERHSGRGAFFPSWAAAIDKVDRISPEAAEGMTKFFVHNDKLQAGYRNVPYVDLRAVDLSEPQRAKVLDAVRSSSSAGLNAEEQKAFDIVKKTWDSIYNERVAEGLTTKHSPKIPDILSDKSINLFTSKAGSLEYKNAIRDWAMHVERSGRTSFKTAYDNIKSYLASMVDNSNINPNAIAEVREYPIPNDLRENDLYKMVLKYGRWAARDMAFWKQLQSDPQIASLLNLSSRGGKITKLPHIEPIIQHPDVANAMKFIFNDFTYIKNPRIMATVRAINSALLGAPSGIRNTAQLPALMAPYLETTADVTAMFKGFAKAGQERRTSLEYGARSGTMDMDRWMALDSADPYTSFMNKASEIMRKYQGRDAMEQMDRLWTFSGGKEIAKNKILELANPKTAKAAQAWLDKFGTLAKDSNGNWDVNQIAKNVVDRVQGTYDARGLPAGAFDSAAAPFLGLSRWGIEKSNVLYKDVIQPAIEGKNFKPLLVYTLGSFLTGAAIRELNQLLSGRKDYTPSLKEAADQKNPEYMVASLVNLMQMGSYMGFMSDLAKTGSDLLIQKKAPKGPVNFPAADFITDTLGTNIGDTLQAIKNGVNPAEAVMRLAYEIIRSSIQNVRMLDSRVFNAEDTERSNKFRDMQVFKSLSGDDNESIEPHRKSRINVTPESDFRREQDLGKAAEMVPKLLAKAIEDAKGDPYKMKANLTALKMNNYQTMPNPQSAPIEFLKYVGFLERTQGSEEASKRLQDYLQVNAVNKAKSSMVP